MAEAAASCRVQRRRPVPGGAEPQGRVDRAPVRRAPGSRGFGGRSRPPDRGRRRARGVAGQARAGIGAEVLLHVRELRDRRRQPLCPRRRPDRRRASRAGIQPALHLRRRGRRQDTPRPGDRQLRHALRPGARGPLRDRGNLHQRVHGGPPALGPAGLQERATARWTSCCSRTSSSWKARTRPPRSSSTRSIRSSTAAPNWCSPRIARRPRCHSFTAGSRKGSRAGSWSTSPPRTRP